MAEDYEALIDISTKAEAKSAYFQAIKDLWNERDKLACNEYISLINQAEELQNDLLRFSEQPYLSLLKTDKGRITKKALNQRLRVSKNEEETKIINDYLNLEKKHKNISQKANNLLTEVENQYKKQLNSDHVSDDLHELQAIINYSQLLEKQSQLKTELNDAEATLDKNAYNKYPVLSEEDVKTLVIADKWLSTIAAAVQGEVDRVTQTLAIRIRQLAERYDTPLPQIADEVAKLATRVDEHLKKMGAVW